MGVHPAASVAIFVPLWLIATVVGSAVPVGIWAALHHREIQAALRSGAPNQALSHLFAGQGDLMILGSALAAFPVFGVVALCRIVIDRRPMSELGLAWNPRHLAIGLGLSAATVLAIFGLLVLTGQLEVSGFSPASATPRGLATVAGMFVAFFLQSGTEELVCRGYLMRTAMVAWRPAVSVAVVSLFFGALHLLNPGTSAMSFLQTTLIGVLFSQVCLITRGLWVAVGLHTAWNFTLAVVTSLPVSGMRTSHLLEVKDVGSRWMTGAEYGPEASVVTLLVVCAACVALGLRMRRAHLPGGAMRVD